MAKYANQNTKYANQNTKYTNQNYLNQKNTPIKTQGMPSKSKEYANQNTKYAILIKRIRRTCECFPQHWFSLFCRKAIFVANLRTCLAYFVQVQKMRWCTKNVKYQVCVL